MVKCEELLPLIEARLEATSAASFKPDDETYIVWLTAQKKRAETVVADIRGQNISLLQMIYPGYFTSADVVFASDVNGNDQDRRLRLAVLGALVFVCVGFLSNVNASSLHGVYRDEIADVWLQPKKLLMKDLCTSGLGEPFHLINCTMNHLSSSLDPDSERRSRFVISHRFCGSKRTGYRKTEEFQDGNLTVADAVAISGAAVTVTAADNLLYRVLLVLTNFRMGQWLRNPAHYYPDHFWPSPLRTLLGLIWDPQNRSYCYVSDGGHLDNTGLAALLERRCKLMICSDASDDPQYQFEDLMRVLQASRAKYNLQFMPLDSLPVHGSNHSDILDRIRPQGDSWSRQHFLAFKVIYPQMEHVTEPDALLIVIKSSLTGDEPLDLLELKKRSGLMAEYTDYGFAMTEWLVSRLRLPA